MGMARGSVNHPLLALWLEEGRMHPGTGSLRSPLCSLSLLLPACANLAETNLASVTAIPTHNPPPAITSSPPPLPPPHAVFYRFTSVIPAAWETMEGITVHQGHNCGFVCVACFQKQHSASKKLTRKVLSVCVREKGDPSAQCVWQQRGCAWPCSWDDVLSSLPRLNSHVVLSALDLWCECFHWARVSADTCEHVWDIA